MKKVLLFLLIAQSAHAMMQEQDGICVILRKAPFLTYHGAKQGTPFLITVVNSKNIPLLISPASVSLPLLTFGQVHSLLAVCPGMEVFNALMVYVICACGSMGSGLYAVITATDTNLDSFTRVLHAASGSLSSIGLAILAFKALSTCVAPKNSLSNIESYYLYLPSVIKPLGSLDKLIWLESEKPNSLKISLFLPNNNSLDFNFTADQLEALA